MTEKNRHILDEALKGMPEHKADAAAWESVAGGLAQAEEAQFLSDNLSSLPVHKAPAGAWSGIVAGLKAPFISLTGGLMKTTAFVAATAAIVTALLIFIPEEKVENMQPASEVEKTTARQEVRNSAGSGTQVSNNDHAEKAAGIPVKAEEEEPANDHQMTASDNPDFTIYNKVSVEQENPASENSGTSISAVEMNSRNAAVVPDQLSIKELIPIAIQELSAARELSIRATAEKAHTDYYRKRGVVDFAIAPFYSLINYQQAEIANMEVPESISGFGFDFMAEFPDFFLKTGVSYLSFREKAKYTFEYRRNELVYSYNYVDSAFINHTSGDITFHTSERNIYDSVPGEKADEIKYEYKVLQIPLVAGYKIYNKNNIGFSFNAGIGADLRIGGREYQPAFNEEEARLVNTVNYLDYRFKINWRIIAGAGLYYRISNRFSFYLEPSYQQYLKSMHQHSGSGNVSYLEIKSGFIWKF